MKFLQLSDLHLGKKMGAYSLLEDQKYLLKQALRIVDEEGTDFVLIVGDIYDRSLPPGDALALYDAFLEELILKRDQKVFVIAGNHDSGVRIGHQSKLAEKSGYFASGVLEEKMHTHIMECGGKRISVSLLPYANIHDFRPFLEEDPKNLSEAHRMYLEKQELPQADFSILLLHQLVLNEPEEMEEDDRYQMEGMLGFGQDLKSRDIPGFDYVALGHIHRNFPAAPHMYYCGSLQGFRPEEIGQQKYFQVVEIEDGYHVKRIPVKPLRSLERVEGSYEEILEEVAQRGVNDNYVFIELTDKKPVADAYYRLKEWFPHLVQMKYKTLEREWEEEHKLQESMEFQDVITSFFRWKTGEDPDEETISLVKELRARMEE